MNNYYTFSRITLFVLITLFVSPRMVLAQGSKFFTNDGSGTNQSFEWTIPAGVTTFTVECWGGGGSGAGNSGDTNGAGGGGGGAYSKKTFTGQTPGTKLDGEVGGYGYGTTEAGMNGGDSWLISNTSTGVLAKGGKGGNLHNVNSGAGGAGGQANDGFGGTKWSGGNGGQGRQTGSNGTGGGGGSAAAATKDGNSGGTGTNSPGAGGDDPDGSGIAGAGGGGSTGGATPASNGSNYGGGGGGTGDCNGRSGSGAKMVGGSGKAGYVYISWTCTVPTGVTASATPNPICVGNTLTLTGGATGATTWSWTGPNNFASSLQNPTIANITTAGAGVYTLTASNSCGSATAVSTSSVTVNTVPTGVTASATPNPICVGNTLTLTGGATGATTWSWTGPNNFASSLQNPTIANITTAGAGVYTLTASNSCGSATAVSTSSVTVNTVPTGVTASATPNPICAGNTLTLTGGATGATTWSWTGPNNFASSLQNPTIANITTAGAGVYTLTASNSCGPATAVSTSSVTVNTVPTGVTASATPNTICAGNTLTLTGGATGATNWSWTGPNGFTSTLQNPTIANITTAGAGVYTLIASNTCGPAPAVNTSSVTVNPTPVVPAQSTTICSGTSPNITPTNNPPTTIVPIGTTYTWTNPTVTGGITGGSAQGTPQASVNQTLTNPTNTAQTATYTVTPTSGTCTGATFQFVVTVLAGGSWIGGTAGNLTDWNTTTNWCGSFPNSTSPETVTIPVVPNQPHVTMTDPTLAECKNLTINPGASVTIDAGKALTVHGDLTNNGTLTIDSDANGSGSLIVKGSGSGNVTYNRYMDKSRWYIVSSPLSGADIDDIVIKGNVDNEVYGTYDFATYNEPNNKWVYAAGNSGEFVSGQGYLIRIEDTGLDKQPFKGTLVNADVPISVTSVNTRGWNAVGNPYTSAIKIKGTDGFITLNATTLEDDHAAVYLYNEGSYKVINNTGYDVLPPVYTGMSLLTGISNVQPGQGFLVNVKRGSTGPIIFTKGTTGMQIHDPSETTPLKSAETSWPGITLLAEKSGQTAGTVVTFWENMTTGLDKTYDAGLFSSNSFKVYTRLVTEDKGVNFVIQALPDNQYSQLTVPVGIDLPEGGDVTFKAAGIILPTGIYPSLEDRLLQVITPLRSESDTYTVILPGNNSGIGRFFLHFGQVTGVKHPTQETTFSAFFADRKIVISGTPQKDESAVLYDIGGRTLGVYPLLKDHRNEIPAGHLISGIYLLRVGRQVIKVPVLNR